MVNRSDRVHLIRDGVLVHSGSIASLKRFKDDVREVSSGYECGIGIENFNDIKAGDDLEFYKLVETAKTLDVKGEV
jgi:translation initiation factor IF-2